jgi:hypothetical protein
MSLTVEDQLNLANDSTVNNMLAQLRDANGDGLGKILNGLVPRFVTRSGLTSGATHIETNPGYVIAIQSAGGVDRTLVYDGAAGAGEVKVTYSAAGIPTLVFGDGANTGYLILKIEIPIGLLAALEADGG